MGRILRFAVGALATATLLGGCASQGPAPPGVTYARFQFTCCLASDVGQPWHAGQTVELHWIVRDGGATADNNPRAIVLNAALTGAYADVATLKAQRSASRTLTSATIRVDDRNPTPPVSVFTLPADMVPGFYNLTIKVDFGGGNSMDGASVIQVASP